MNDATAALDRAITRILFHDWRQGPAHGPVGSPGVGYTLREAITGVKRSQLANPSPGVDPALVRLEWALPVEFGNDIDAFNEHPGRTRDEILAVLEEAKVLGPTSAPPEGAGTVTLQLPETVTPEDALRIIARGGQVDAQALARATLDAAGIEWSPKVEPEKTTTRDRGEL